MPYKPDGSDVPENIAKLPDEKRRQWAQVFNSALSRCEKDGGKDCESSAFAQANGVVLEKKEAETEPQEADKSTPCSLTVYKALDGSYRWASVSSMAVQDKEFETVSERAYDDAITHARNTKRFGELDLVHVVGTDVGDCDFMARADKMLIEGGAWRDTPLALGARKAVEDKPDQWEVSIRFEYDPSKFVDGVYTGNIRVVKRSILPAGMAASYGTKFVNVGGTSMDEKVMSEQTKEALELLNVPPDQIAELAEKQTQLPANEKAKQEAEAEPPKPTVWQRLIEAAKRIVDPLDHEPDVVETEAVEEKAETVEEVEPDMGDVVKSITEAVSKQVGEYIVSQQKSISELEAQLADLQVRFTLAEKALEDKVLARLEELPRVVKVQKTELAVSDVEDAPAAKQKPGLLTDIEKAVKSAYGETEKYSV